jgi:hypothetical protein
MATGGRSAWPWGRSAWAKFQSRPASSCEVLATFASVFFYFRDRIFSGNPVVFPHTYFLFSFKRNMWRQDKIFQIIIKRENT